MKKNLINILITLIIGFIIYYIFLPAINIHNVGFWFYLCSLLFIYGALNSFSKINIKNNFNYKDYFLFYFIAFLLFIIILVSLINKPIFMSSKYANRISISDNISFSDGVKEVDFNKIALLDKDSTRKLGDRVMGSLSDVVSQFYVSDLYTQINYNNDIVRVTPLEYMDTIKYFANRKDGVKGYIIVNSVTGEATLKRLDKGMKYVQSAYFFENVRRYLRFNYPFDNFGEESFEIDNEGNPYWIMPIIKYSGVNQRRDVSGVITLNAITGETNKYDINNVPSWIDHVFSPEIIIEQVNDWGNYKNGFWNTLFSQKGMVNTTDGYNYLVMNDDVYLYTGITSVSSDESNLGFILSNLRTKETNFYSLPSAEEYSAMDSAEGAVQQMGYHASFPLLINLEGKPTYLISLKDDAGLVKMYAFVNVVDYQKVIVSDANLGIEVAANNYLRSVGISNDNKKEIIIKNIDNFVIDGNTYYFIIDTNDNKYRASIKVNTDILPFLKKGDKIIVSFTNKSVREILSIY